MVVSVFTMAGVMRLSLVVCFFVRHVMMVKVKEALEKKHRQKTSHQPDHGTVNGTQLLPGVWEQVQQAYTQHQTRHETGALP